VVAVVIVAAAGKQVAAMTAITTAAGAGFAPDVQAFDPAETVPEALIIKTATFTVPVEGDAVAVQVPYVDADDDAGFVAEGAAITEASPDTTNVEIYTGKIAVLGKVSREQYGQTGMSSLLANSFRRAVVKKANNAYLAQAAPVGPAVTPPAGLLNLSPTDGGTVGADLDAIIDAIAAIEDAYGAPTHVIANPTAWASVLKLKTGTGSNQSLVGAGTADADRGLLSVPVLTSPAVPVETLLVVDKASVLASWGSLFLAVSEHAYFGSDSIGVRCTWRFGAKIVDTDRVVELTITDA
jgi:HK97 family phage major capsid protein